MNVLMSLNKKKQERKKYEDYIIDRFIKGTGKNFPTDDDLFYDTEIMEPSYIKNLKPYQIDMLSRLLKLKD